jgi:hypothetical protein
MRNHASQAPSSELRPLRIDLAPVAAVANRLRPVATPIGTPEHFRIGFAATENALRPLRFIRSLAYFQPVIEELQDHSVPDGYLDYPRLKLRGLMDKAGPTKFQKSTLQMTANTQP